MESQANTLKSRQEDGSRFEAEVSSLYKAMGYTVKNHVPLCGQEVDILATREVPGTKPHVVIVECKFKGSGATIGNQDVQSIAGAFLTARNSGIADACTIVTTNGFSLSAQTAADAAGIHLVTRDTLQRQLIDFSPYLRRLKSQYYESFGSGTDSCYIDPIVTSEKRESSLDAFADQWLSTDGHQPLALLGGYGSGKTSFCRHFAVRLLERQVQSPIPVLIQLRDFRSARKIESVIRDFLDEECGAISPRFETFWRMYEEGLLLLIFDGFDEMAARVDASVVEENLQYIEKFCRTRGNVLLTCRPEYFATKSEEDSAFNPPQPLSDRLALYRPARLSLWTPEQVSRYVTRRVATLSPTPPHPASFYLERIWGLPELHDMSTRAVHLDLIVRFLPSMIAKGAPITRLSLYETYIEKELARETISNRRLKLISDSDRLGLLRTIASSCLLDSKDDINFEEAKTIVSRQLNPPGSELDFITRDLLNRSFLLRDGDRYRFAHKSIGEYLLAIELNSQIRRGDLTVLNTKTFPSAIAGMVLEFFGGLRGFADFVNVLDLESSPPTPDSEYASRVLFATASLRDSLDGIRSAFRNRDSSRQPGAVLFDGFAHDLANSVHSLQALEQVVTHRGVEERDRVESLRRLADHWQRIRIRLSNVLVFSVDRLAGVAKLMPRVTEVSLSAVISTAIQMFPELPIHTEATPLKCLGDREFLVQVVENVLINAKYALRQTNSSGSIRLWCEQRTDSRVALCIGNNGPLIPNELQDRIFDAGFTTRREGMGLGLFMARTLVEHLGGTISVRSSTEETVFEIELAGNIMT